MTAAPSFAEIARDVRAERMLVAAEARLGAIRDPAEREAAEEDARVARTEVVRGRLKLLVGTGGAPEHAADAVVRWLRAEGITSDAVERLADRLLNVPGARR